MLKVILMINKLFMYSLILLGLSTSYFSIHSCGSRPQILKFVNPPISGPFWHEEGIVVWPALPVRVRVDGPMWEMVTEDADRSIRLWNTSIGCEVLTASRDEDAEIVVAMRPRPRGSDWIGSAKYVHREFGGRRYWGSDIALYDLRLNDKEIRDNVMTHELGHSLGLRDLTKEEDNVMHRATQRGKVIDTAALYALHQIYCAR